MKVPEKINPYDLQQIASVLKKLEGKKSPRLSGLSPYSGPIKPKVNK
jgi:hypothetical protein